MKSKTNADLHIHSYYSDGTLSPKEILDIAANKEVGVIAITDHNELEGARELQKLGRDSDLICIPGIELDALYHGINLHILGYGIDLYDESFCKFTRNNLSLLEEANIRLVKKMELDYSQISLSEYQNFCYDRRKGGWKALHYFVEKGIAKIVDDAFVFYSKYGSTYNCINFPQVDEVCKYIHLAGGKAILAHPAKIFKYKHISELETAVQNLFVLGLDGVECYYPSHSAIETTACLGICIDRNAMITSGSDCHGSFEDTEIGEPNTPAGLLNLGNLLQ